MKRYLLVLLLVASSLFAQDGLLNGVRTIPVANDPTTGTTPNALAIISSTGAITATTSNTNVPIYLCVAYCGSTGYAHLAVVGLTASGACPMDSSSSTGNGEYYVIASTTTSGGYCHAQATAPASGTGLVGFLIITPSSSNLQIAPQIFGGGTGGGGISSFSSGNLAPLFTTNVATPTTTPAQTFSLSAAAQNSVLAGPPTGGAGPPSYQLAPTFSAANLTNFPPFNATNLLGGAAGSLLYQTALNATGFLAVGTTGCYLFVTAGVPAWDTLLCNNGTTLNYSGTGGITAAAYGANGSSAGASWCTQGALPWTVSPLPPVNSIGVICPIAVTSYWEVPPGTGPGAVSVKVYGALNAGQPNTTTSTFVTAFPAGITGFAGTVTSGANGATGGSYILNGSTSGSVNWATGATSGQLGASTFVQVPDNKGYAFSQNTGATATTGAVLGVIGTGTTEAFDTTGGTSTGLFNTGNKCVSASPVTLTNGSYVTVCSWTLPNVAKQWAWNCSLDWDLTTLGTTPTLAIAMNAVGALTGENGSAIIYTTNSSTVTRTEAHNQASNSTGDQAILTSASPGGTGYYTVQTWGTIRALSTTGTFSIDAELAGASAAGNIGVSSECVLY